MNALRSSSPWWRLLALGVIVLLAHLWLLQAMATQFESTSAPAVADLQFSTRTIAAATPLAPVHSVQSAKRQPKPRPKAQASELAAAVQSEPPSADQQVKSEPVANVATATGPEEPASAPDAQQDAATSADAAPAAPAQESASAAAPAASSASLAEEVPAAKPPRERPFDVNTESLSASTRLVYVVNTSKFPYRLSGELLWRNGGETYSARLRYSAFGQARVQTSRGRIAETGLAPERFSDKYRSEVAAHFNYPQGKVTFSANTPDAPLLSGAQDRLSVLLQLGAIVGSEPERFAPGVTLTIPTVGPRDADVWLFTVVATEHLNLPGGTVDGVKLERLPREPYDQKVELWLSPQLNYLPARIRITETNGDSIDQQWQASEAAGAAD